MSAVGNAVRVTDYATRISDYRHALRHYLAELSWAAQWRSAAFGSSEEAIAFDAEVLSRLYAAGWNRYGWPTQVGGLGGSELHRGVLFEELANAMLPVPAQFWTLEVLGPALLKFAPALAAEYLPRYLQGAEWWGQGFSEPQAGSDLAALGTRASDDGAGSFVINGQKTWTSQGTTATRLLVLARTGAPDSRHHGLSMLLVDADAPGVTVRPIELASGRRELGELFFDDVRVPHDRLIGELGGGWAVAMFLMQYERGMYGYGVSTKLLGDLSRLREHMVASGASEVDRNRFARIYISVLTAQARSASTVRQLARGSAVGADSSIDKLLFTRAEKDVSDLTFDARRQWMIAGEPHCSAAELDTERAQWWYSRAATIMGGTAQIQRGIVADHILDLPREGRGR
ncbi:acyl-CoA dehydrogenase family protein [Mycobacterium colombiense]